MVYDLINVRIRIRTYIYKYIYLNKIRINTKLKIIKLPFRTYNSEGALSVLTSKIWNKKLFV